MKKVAKNLVPNANFKSNAENNVMLVAILHKMHEALININGVSKIPYNIP